MMNFKRRNTAGSQGSQPGTPHSDKEHGAPHGVKPVLPVVHVTAAPPRVPFLCCVRSRRRILILAPALTLVLVGGAVAVGVYFGTR